ncbi:hypothetical protein [Nonomuraea jiangxiensis]|uniref:hypothetical protein n=1 Tax=Nonomuraea jiangxiensis TaxID=633440 RepID=UPI00115FC9D9|nr:hypothetical protein [Nonomuraea jiangxiensis]
MAAGPEPRPTWKPTPPIMVVRPPSAITMARFRAPATSDWHAGLDVWPQPSIAAIATKKAAMKLANEAMNMSTKPAWGRRKRMGSLVPVVRFPPWGLLSSG